MSRFDTFSNTLPSGEIRFDSIFKRQFRRKQKQQTKTLPPHIFMFRHVDSAWIFPLFSGYVRSFPRNFRQGKKRHMFMQCKLRAAEKVPNTSPKNDHVQVLHKNSALRAEILQTDNYLSFRWSRYIMTIICLRDSHNSSIIQSWFTHVHTAFPWRFATCAVSTRIPVVSRFYLFLALRDPGSPFAKCSKHANAATSWNHSSEEQTSLYIYNYIYIYR